MRAFFASVVVAIVVAGGALYALDGWWQRQANKAFTSPSSVRLPDDSLTHNLVGKDWYSAKEH